MAKILVVDDEKIIVKGIRFSLLQDQMEVDCAYDGEQAVEMARNTEYDVVLLDVMLPKLDGFQVCQAIREFSNMPIIMLTAKGDDMDKILGLEYGADDYVTKPFNILEVKARIKAIMRRSSNTMIHPPQPPVKTKNSTPLIVALCCTLTAVIMIGIGVVLFTNSKNSQTAGNTARAESGKEAEKVAENTTAATQSTTESKSQDTQQSTTEQQAAATQAASTTEDTVDTQAVGADGNEEIFEDTDASADYSECLSLDNYTYLESPDGDYTFYYPQNVYNYAYYDGDSCIFTSDDENDTVKFIRKDNTSGSPAQGMENLYNSYTNLSQKEKILFREETDERGFARGVLSGITDNQNVYASIAANDDYVYIMEVCTSFQHDSTKSTWVEYYIDCMYRYCSFSRRVGDPRSYDEYMKDQ